MPDLLDQAMEERLDNGAECNPDGHGWAVIVGKHIITGKSMSADEAILTFRMAYREATGPALFHSRWATHGSKNLSNVHPFLVRKISDTFVAHNGIMPESSHPLGADLRSDTRVFADDILPIRYKRLDKPTVRESLSGWLKGNKIAILTTNPRFERNLYMFGTEGGDWVDGVWFSNGDHEGYARYGKWLGQSYRGQFADDECLWCKQLKVNLWDICEGCGTCQKCFEPQDLCECYSGAGKDWKADAEGTPLTTPLALEAPRETTVIGYHSGLGREYAKGIEDAQVTGEVINLAKPAPARKYPLFYRWPGGTWRSTVPGAHTEEPECQGGTRCGGNHQKVDA